MTNQTQSSKLQKYDLEERTAIFGEKVIKFVKQLTEDSINRPLINQLIRSATSIGANYMEADGANSKQDFNHKISICKKEAKETLHWLRMVAVANVQYKEICRELWKESHEFVLIFSAILKKRK